MEERHGEVAEGRLPSERESEVEDVDLRSAFRRLRLAAPPPPCADFCLRLCPSPNADRRLSAQLRAAQSSFLSFLLFLPFLSKGTEPFKGPGSGPGLVVRARGGAQFHFVSPFAFPAFFPPNCKIGHCPLVTALFGEEQREGYIAPLAFFSWLVSLHVSKAFAHKGIQVRLEV